MNIVWQRRAKHHVETIREYIRQFNPTAAVGMAEQIVKSVGTLASFPQIGKAGRVQDTRELAVAGTPYIIVYRVRDEVVIILAIFHGAQIQCARRLESGLN